MMLHMSCVLLVWGSLSALGAHLDVEEAPPDNAAPDLYSYLAPHTQWGPSLADTDDFDFNVLDQIPSERLKRAGNGPSLSIINPLDVLRQRLLLEMARRQMRESQKQVAENRKLMKTIGKRAGFLRSPYTFLP